MRTTTREKTYMTTLEESKPVLGDSLPTCR